MDKCVLGYRISLGFFRFLLVITMSGSENSVAPCWQQTVASWLKGKFFSEEWDTKSRVPINRGILKEWNIMTLVNRLENEGIIPPSVKHDSSLYFLLMAEITRQLTLHLVVPIALNLPTHTTPTVDCTTMKLYDHNNDVKKWKSIFQKETGVKVWRIVE